ncbi:hypothetical protein [Streptomyces sp.]|uniref:hypothetical protein n=1 Tax=Streptomyces sp. TaxID=1931 RepID=UPI002F928882
MKTMKVYANQGWQATGVYGEDDINRGVLIQADGEWSYKAGKTCGPDGASWSEPGVSASGDTSFVYPADGSTAGQLLGRWGEDDARIIPVGKRRSEGGYPGSSNRQLYLRMNDRKEYYEDNSGHLEVVIDTYDRSPDSRNYRWNRLGQYWEQV